MTRPGCLAAIAAIAALYAVMSLNSAALSASLYAGTGRRSGTLPTKIFASVPETRASTIAPRSFANDAGPMVAFMSFTASQIDTTVGRCAIAPGRCALRARRGDEPDAPTFTNALPGGRRFAIRAGHEPVAGSVAPTPTVSDAP